MSGLLVLAPLAIEAAAIRRATLPVRTVGMGPERARRAAAALDENVDHVVVVGLGGALSDDLHPGDVVLATEVRDRAGHVVSCDVERMASVLDAAGLAVTRRVVLSVEHVVNGPERRQLADTGASVVDMESYWLAPIARARFDVVRVIVDTPTRELTRPLATAIGGARALRVLRRVGAALATIEARPR